MGFLTRKKRPEHQSPTPIDHLGYQMGAMPFPPQPLASSPPHFQPGGHSSSSQVENGYSSAGPSHQSGNQRPYPPIIVNQHYYLGAPPTGVPMNHPYMSTNACSTTPGKLKLGSALDLANDMMPCNIANNWQSYGTQLLGQSVAVSDEILTRFNSIMTLIDGDKFCGDEQDLFMYDSALAPNDSSTQSHRPPKGAPRRNSDDVPKGQSTAVATLASKGYFSKVELYANSKLPLNLPALQLYIPSYPLLCLAAQYSEKVYERPRGAERDVHVNADWKTGTKAMCIKSVPMDHMDTIVFAIRGTASFMDWAVNLNTEPTAPTGFLDDTGNLCHAGFLNVARKMIAPVAARLRQLLEENPRRSSYSLLMTGHSAGGAIASLLYSHMLATSSAAASELNALTGCFRRVHCITFGTPPVSLLPLQRPAKPEFKKFMFLTFVNEGDPVARADKAYVKSLLDLLGSPPPPPADTKRPHRTSSSPPPLSSSGRNSSHHSHCHGRKPREKKSKFTLGGPAKGSRSSVESSSSSSSSSKSNRSSSSSSKKHHHQQQQPTGPIWPVPPCPLSSPGRIVVLRSGDPGARVRRAKSLEARLAEGVVAQVASDEHLRSVIWGDPLCHVMKFYAARIEVLAVGAVTVQGH